MSNTIEFQGTRDSQAHRSKPLDETVRRAWLKKNFLEERPAEVAEDGAGYLVHEWQALRDQAQRMII
jgi:hypothetical protein